MILNPNQIAAAHRPRRKKPQRWFTRLDPKLTVVPEIWKDCVACYPMWENADTIYDVAPQGYKYSGTLSSDVSWQKDFSGTGTFADVETTSNDPNNVINLGAAPSASESLVPTSADFTALFLADIPSDAGDNGILYGQNSANSDGLVLYSNTNFGDATNELRLYDGTQIVYGGNIRGAGPSVVVFRRSGDDWTIFVNGVVTGSNTTSNTLPSGTNHQRFRLQNVAREDRTLDGWLGYAQFWHRALTDSEIKLLGRDAFLPITPSFESFLPIIAGAAQSTLGGGGGGTDYPQGLHKITNGFNPQRSTSLGGELQ